MNKKIKQNRQPSTVNHQPSKIDIDHVAKLANLPLTPEEKEKFGKQLGEVLIYINKLGEVSTKDIEPIGQITGLVNITRPDEAAPSISQEDALKNAARKYNGFFEVEAIFEE